MKVRIRYAVPAILLLVIATFLGIGLTQNPSLVPSPLIGKTAPPIVLPEVANPERTFDSAALHGKVWLLNVWASWCVSCRQEHPLLMALSSQTGVPLYGLDYEDTRGAAMQWLSTAGNPYRSIANDPKGKVGMNFGVYGVPETYVIDKQGVVRYKQVGPLSPQVVEHTILPLVARLSQ